MNPDRFERPIRTTLGATLAVALAALAFGTSVLLAQKAKNPASKVYVSDVNGDAQIDTGDNIQDLNKRSVYNAEGTIIETKKVSGQDDKTKGYTTTVFSNGTGAFFDQDTKVEVKRFVQEPFTPNRSDMDVEPSISNTQAFVARGTVGLCTSKLVAGSSMNYSTPHGGINIRGRKVVIEANDNETKISMLEGDSTVRGGDMDMGGSVLKEGQQAIIRRGRAGQAAEVRVQAIPQSETAALDDKVAMACMAKKTVYFEVRERKTDSSDGPASGSSSTTTESGSSAAEGTGSTASGADTGGGSVGASPPVTAFDGPAANNNSTARPPTIVREIVPVEVVPVNLPVEYTVSPARIVKPTPKG
jgi:hypothetical protein